VCGVSSQGHPSDEQVLTQARWPMLPTGHRLGRKSMSFHSWLKHLPNRSWFNVERGEYRRLAMLSTIAEIIRDLLIFIGVIAALLIALLVVVSKMPNTNPLKRILTALC
jgi:hypothetical protein